MRTLAARGAALALVAAIVSPAIEASHAQVVAPAITPAPTNGTPPLRFTKQALDANGVPLTGPPSVGQTIQYVLSYNAVTSPLGFVTVDDTLSPNLAYVNPSIAAPPGWTWSLPPYSVGNHETYSNRVFGPGMSFVVNVPVADVYAPAGPAGGDGTIPIPVGTRIYGVNHHLNAGAATIMCWQLSSLTRCFPTPRSIGSDLMTPSLLRHAVVGTKIYFPSARVQGSGSTATTIPGIGCWDTSTETPCAFIPLASGLVWAGPAPTPGGNWYPSGLDPLVAGIAADSTLGRLFMYAADSASAPTTGRVYCVLVSGSSCGGWSLQTLAAGGNDSIGDMALEETASGSPATRLYVTHSGRVTCLPLSNGSPCNSTWINVAPPSAIPPARIVSLSSFPNNVAPGAIQVCVSNYRPAGVPICFDTAGTIVSLASAGAFGAAMNSMAGKTIVFAFRVPGTARVLLPYGSFTDATTPLCFDFKTVSTGVVCAPPDPFVPAFSAGNNFRDYGYAVDPAEPDRCLLGLGDSGIVWRFTRDGGFGANGCVKRVEQTFDINSFFCAKKPKDPKWDSIIIRNRLLVLTGGTINLVNSANTVVRTITILPSPTDTYAVNIPATGANSQLTVQFTPTYSGQPTLGYQLELTFTADVDPQICYKATVTACGPVSNQATMAGFIPTGGPSLPVNATAGVDLGAATGPMCQPSLLKMCKVAGPGVAVGTPFTFTAALANGVGVVKVPAGPAPGGFCVIGPNVPVGTNVTVTEEIPAGHVVSGIDVAPPDRQVGKPDLATGSVTIVVGTGLTEVTFTDKRTGFVEICKIDKGWATGTHRFTVNPGGLGPFAVPAGACSPAIEVAAGPVTIREMLSGGTIIVGSATIPADRQGPWTNETSMVTVVPGDVSTTTIATVTNGPGIFIPDSGRTTFGATTTTLACDPNLAPSRQPVTCTAKAAPAARNPVTPTGVMSFMEGNATLAKVQLSPDDGTAVFATSTMAPGTHSIVASYGGDTDFDPSSAEFTVTVQP
jgi:hypothetical protein